jgi:protein tyrosine phosphatase (PTP) superfamily phosphohydrolase (DUF442 family)/YHS domain-containing protein
MKSSRAFSFVALALACACGVAAQCVPASQPLADTSTIRNFLRVNENFCTGGQPRLEHLESLKKEGVTTIINLRTPGEHRAADEEDMAKKLGLRYFNIPVNYSDPRDSDADEFLRVTDDPKNRPAFIHCTAAIRVGAFWMIRRVLRDGRSVADAEEEAEKIGLRNAPHLVEFARAYIAKHNPQAAAVAPPARTVPVAIEGIDPVLLVQGTEKQGDPKISFVHEGFEFLFSSSATKAEFTRNPQKYEIQLGGLCARMGGTTLGSSDLWAVVDGRIYVFGSEECRKRFKAAPQKYLEPKNAPLNVSAKSAKEARSLIEKAVKTLGGTAKLDALSTLQRTEQHVTQRGEQKIEYKILLATNLSDRWRLDREFGNGASLASVIAPSDSFSSYSARGRTSTDVFSAAQRAHLQKQFRHDPLVLLRARNDKRFSATVIGPGKAGNADVQIVVADFDGVRSALGIDPKSGRVLSLRYADRGPEGEYGEIIQVFSDFRDAGGLMLPHRAEATWNGSPLHTLSYSVATITINAPLAASLFERPKTNSTSR